MATNKKQLTEFTHRMAVLKQFLQSSTNKHETINRLDTE